MATQPFTAEQQALRAEVGRFVEQRLIPVAADAESGAPFPRAVLRHAAALGYLGMLDEVPEEPTDLLAAVVVAEELGRVPAAGLVAVLLGHAFGALPLLRAAGHPAAPRLASGEALAALGVERAVAVIGAAAADLLVIVRDGTALLVGDAAITPARALGLHSGALGDVAMEEATLTPLAVPPAAVLSRWRLVTAAAAVAATWDTWEQAKAYALQREAFGRPIGRFQVNRHTLADAATQLTAARQLVHDQAVAGAADAQRVAAAARYAERTAAAVADVCLQLHGGYGYAADAAAGRAWRDARTARHGLRALAAPQVRA